MATWDDAFAFLIANEGTVYTNRPDDRGGPTKFGISKHSYPNLDIEHLTLQQAKDIYFRDFWIVSHANLIADARLSIKFFDTAVNMGISRAAKLLQETLNFFHPNALVVDGNLGQKSIQAINDTLASPKMRLPFLMALCARQWWFYATLIQGDASQASFAVGWTSRAFRLPPE